MYNVYGSQNEFVKRITRVFILRMRSLGQNGPLQRKTISVVASIPLFFVFVTAISSGPMDSTYADLTVVSVSPMSYNKFVHVTYLTRCYMPTIITKSVEMSTQASIWLKKAQVAFR